ncbi:MAG: hypothetical protein AB7G87_01070 [Clostridia bacterium]
MKNIYAYKFSTDDYDYYRDNRNNNMVKVSKEIPGGRSDKTIQDHCIDAEDDLEVMEFFN